MNHPNAQSPRVGGPGNAGALAIRADAGPGIGAGHVVRCAALADAWRRTGGTVDWFCRPLPPLLDSLVTSRGVKTHLVAGDDWDDVTSWSRRHQGAWVCIDGYQFSAGPPRVRAAGGRAFVLADDHRQGPYQCDALLNQVIGAERLRYHVEPNTLVMLGSRYCLLRDEFVALSPAPPPEAVSRVFVSFGGHDAHRQGNRVIDLLAPRYSAMHFDAAAGVMTEGPGRSAHQNVTWHASTDLSRVMHAAGIAIVAAGSVCWELAYLGVPALAIVVADNQEPLAEGLHAAGVARSLGWFNRAADQDIVSSFEALLDRRVRTEMSARGRRLIDGKGGDRVVRVLQQGRIDRDDHD